MNVYVKKYKKDTKTKITSGIGTIAKKKIMQMITVCYDWYFGIFRSHNVH